MNEEQYKELIQEIRAIKDELYQYSQWPTHAERFLNSAEASKLLGIAVKTIYKLSSTRRIPHLKIGGKLIFCREELFAWAKSYRVRTVDELQVEAEADYLQVYNK
jgi:excisionase family DNA binding protein